MKSVYAGEAFVPLKKRNFKSKALPADNLICDAGLVMHKDGKTINNGRTHQNSAAHSVSPSVAVAPVTIRTGITGRKTVVALNTESFHRTTGFPLTAAVSISRGHTLCVQSAKGTPPALRRRGRNDYGCVTAETVRQTSIRLPTFPLLLLLLPLFSLALTPTVHLISFRRAT